jgi:hypothetical protein
VGALKGESGRAACVWEPNALNATPSGFARPSTFQVSAVLGAALLAFLHRLREEHHAAGPERNDPRRE